MGIGGPCENSDENLVKFCRQGPISPLQVANRIIIRTKKKPQNQVDDLISYSQSPLIELCRAHLQLSHKFRLLILQFFVPFLFIRQFFNSSGSVLIASDLPYLPLVRWLDQKSLIETLVLSNSGFAKQPIWMRRGKEQRFALHMLWYSQNIIPKVYRGNQSSNLPQMRHMEIDFHWYGPMVSKNICNLLGKIQLFILLDRFCGTYQTHQKTANAEFKITIFDVTPTRQGHNVFGAIKNYYSTELMIKFIEDIVSVIKDIEQSEDIQIHVGLKSKKGILPSHCQNILSF